MEDKPFAVFDVSGTSIKFLVGYALKGQPIVIYAKETPIPSCIKDGRILAMEELSNALRAFHKFEDADYKLNLNIVDVCLVLPPIGAKIYQMEGSTRGVSAQQEVTRTDVANVIQQVKNQPIPGGNSIVDIIPESFILEDGSQFKEPPLGKVSASLSIKVWIHTLPKAIFDDYDHLINASGFRIVRASLAPYCQAQCLASEGKTPDTCILVDMGGESTILTFLGKGNPYASLYVPYGGASLTEAIAEGFSIEDNEALRLQKRYGYEPRERSYSAVLCESNGYQYRQKDLNAIIESYFDEYMSQIENAERSMMSPYRGKLSSLPIVLTGGFSKLKGMKGFFEKTFSGREIHLHCPGAIGARDPGMLASLGMVLAASNYTGSLEDNRHGVASMSRVKEKNNRRPSRNSPEEDLL